MELTKGQLKGQLKCQLLRFEIYKECYKEIGNDQLMALTMVVVKEIQKVLMVMILD